MSEKKKIRRRGRAGRVIKRWIKRLMLLAVLLAAGLFGLKAYIRNQAEETEEAENYSQAQVIRGAMDETVFGTGTTSARNQPNLLAEADGTLTDLRVSVGDEVKEGDILAVLTNEEIDDTITDLEFALWDLDDTIVDTSAGAKTRKIEASTKGRVMAVYAQKGDDALAVFRREGALAIISTDGRMKVELQSETGRLDLTLGETVKVFGIGVDEVGTVVDLTHQGTRAVITVLNDNLPMGADVTVKKENGDTVGEGTLEVNKPMAISSYGGTISYVTVKVGDEVERREILFQLEDSPLTLKIEDLRLQREAAAKELADAKAQRENLIIVAPCDGIVASLEVKEGDEITSGTLIGSILQGEEMNLTIAVDELDVVEVEPGQPVTITIDALSGMEMQGEVYKIAPVGTNSGGVTTYDVELTFDAAGTGVRSGMNATGEIQIAAADDVLYVPVEALMTINNEKYVMVADGGSMVLSDAFAGQSSRSAQRGSRPAGMPDMGNMPSGAGRPGNMPEGMQGMDNAGKANEAAEDSAVKDSLIDTVREKAMAIYARVRAWLYEGVELSSAEQVTGSVVKVTVGMQNDDYAEITSGLSEGDVVLYTASEESSNSTFGFGGMGGMMGGMGGGPR